MAQDGTDFIIQPDEDIEDDVDSTLGGEVASSTTSLQSSILHYRRENGRTYHRYKDGKYHFPNDEEENDRLDLQHHIFYLTLDGKLGLAPPNEKDAKPAHVLDLGTGTGIWAMDYGDEHPESQVVGVDLSPIQPSFVPVNVSFQIDDFEDDWTYSHTWEYIHSRMMNTSVANWTEYIEKCFKNLSPGGYLELQEFDLPLCDDGTWKPEHTFYKAMKLHREAAANLGQAFIDITKLKDMMTSAGFVDVTEVRFKWPSNGRWPRDKKYKELGTWNNQNMHIGLQGFLMAVLTRGLGWRGDEVNVLVAETMKNIDDRNIHVYWPIYVVYGRKPGEVA